MHTVVKAHLVKIGNSRGVRIPKLLLDQLDLGDEVELAVEEQQLVIRRFRRPRQGWDEQFRTMAEPGDDRLLDDGAANLTQWDVDEWEWT
jgi:antitoxin MazE